MAEDFDPNQSGTQRRGSKQFELNTAQNQLEAEGNLIGAQLAWLTAQQRSHQSKTMKLTLKSVDLLARRRCLCNVAAPQRMPWNKTRLRFG